MGHLHTRVANMQCGWDQAYHVCKWLSLCAGRIPRGDQAGVLCAGQEAASGQEPGR